MTDANKIFIDFLIAARMLKTLKQYQELEKKVRIIQRYQNDSKIAPVRASRHF